MFHCQRMLVLLCLLACQSAFADIQFSRSGTLPVLLELYTSQGCSSCPPADAWVNAFVDDDRLWDDIVPVVFHVDYWNYLGWPDVLSQAQFSARQRRYARDGHIGSVYTPGFVINGKEWRGYFRLRPLPRTASTQGGTLQVRQVNDDNIRLNYRPSQSQDNQGYVGHFAVLGFDLQTDIKAGENRGRLLRYEFAVLSFQTAPLRSNEQGLHRQWSLPEKVYDSPRYGIAAWVTQKATATPVQVLGGFLDNETVAALGW